ncbi:HTH-type transcriptional activator IlvY [Aliikangiella coralliicola]|uniref:HTH-type transcriptional activator IlvY n=1 Tax=Aliikangiella coralliicola TaxID=2592383 RepID=A0A545UJP6_9GAMM|nr:HTH-type transcriptional activator IlvY [Aliikangiella coralliicola]TQV89705.1 HTH-type transcriptional activator IlvY [Aliikangiella coralliicola]
MNIRDLQAFLHLSQSLHFNNTAQEVHTSASTLSRMIQRLESEFDQVFFERDNRSVKLTPAGKRFVEFAESVIAEWRHLKHDFESTQQQLSGEISIYCTVTAAHLYLPKLIEQFRNQYPKVEIILETGDVAIAYQKVSERKVDFAFAVAEEKLPDKYLFQHLYHIPFKIIAPKQGAKFSRFIRADAIDWHQLPFVMPESGPAAQRLTEWLEKMGIKPSIYAHVSGHEAIVSMTALGCGVSAVPQPVLDLSPVKEKVQILPVPFSPKPFDLGMVCLRKRMATPLIAAFWSLVLEAAVE